MLASARISKFQWSEGETFTAEIWLLNDSPAEIPSGEVEVTLSAGVAAERLLQWAYPAVAAGRNLQGPSVQAVLPKAGCGSFELLLRAGPGGSWSSAYRLSLRQDPPPGAACA